MDIVTSDIEAELRSAQEHLDRSRGYAQGNLSVDAKATEVRELRTAVDRLIYCFQLLGHTVARPAERALVDRLRFTVGFDEYKPVERSDGKVMLEIHTAAGQIDVVVEEIS